MLLFYILLLSIIAITAIWLRRQGRDDGHFLRALYLLFALELLWSILKLNNVANDVSILLAGQLLAWGVLLWALEVSWRYTLLTLTSMGLLIFLPLLPELNATLWHFLLMGTLITAVPLATTAFVRQRLNLPIITPATQTASLKPVSVNNTVTQGMIKSQRPILECLADGIIFSGQEGLVEYANQAASLIMGRAKEEIVGRPVTDILAHMPMLGATNDASKMSHFEVNGRIIQGQMSIVYNQKGVAQGTVAILHDITAKYQAEKSRDNFLTTISHELRTPLTAIHGYVELFNSGAGGPLNEKQKGLMQTIQRNVTRMVHLINSLIFASTIKGGRLEYSAGQTDLSQLINQIVREMQSKAAENGQQIKVEIDEHLVPIQADPIHMSTILEELIANAIKYNRRGGEVKLSATLETDNEQRKEFAVVSVSDNGIGIAPNDRAHIFEEFYRPDQLDEQVRAGGLGMGLPIVRALVEAYNGRIWFESTPGSGSTFTFLIPARQAPQATAPLPSEHIFSA